MQASEVGRGPEHSVVQEDATPDALPVALTVWRSPTSKNNEMIVYGQLAMAHRDTTVHLRCLAAATFSRIVVLLVPRVAELPIVHWALSGYRRMPQRVNNYLTGPANEADLGQAYRLIT